MSLPKALGRASVIWTTLATTACGLPTEPREGPPIEIKLDFCSNEIPVWFAYQASADSWTVITPDAAGTYTFLATDQTAIAFVRQDGSDYRTDVIFTSKSVLEGLSGLACLEESGSKQVNGSVLGLSGAQLGLVGMSFSSVYLTADQTSFTLTQLVDRPLDLIASRVDVTGGEQHANKTVIRRAQSLVSGVTMAPVDFNGEGAIPESKTATVSGVGVSDDAFLVNNFFSQLETSHTLSFVDGISNELVPFAAIPASDLAAGDYHDLFVIAAAPNASVRGVERYFRTLVDEELSLGPMLSDPTITVVSSSPNVSLRTRIAGQVEYSTIITSDFHQQTPFSNIDVSMSVTANYFGATPIEWNLSLPNFAGVPGWQNSWGLRSGNIEWTVTGYFGRPQLIFGAKPNDPETVLFASRSSTVAAAQAFRAAHAVQRPRHFSRRRSE